MSRIRVSASALVVAVAVSACGGGNVETDDSFLNAAGPAATPTSLPLGLVRASPAIELVTNGNFSAGEKGWRMSSLSRSELGNVNPFLVEPPPSAQGQPYTYRTVAQLCGYPTQVGATTVNCNDILITADDAALVVPQGATGLQVSVVAYGRYGCKGDNVGHTPLVIGLKPIDGKAMTTPYRIQGTEASLPEGVWRELTVNIPADGIPGVKDAPRSFKLMIGFSTLKPACKGPVDDVNTSVLVAGVSVKASMP